MRDNIIIRKMSDYSYDVSKEVAKVFVDAYYKELSFITKNREKLINALRHSFCRDVIFVAEIDSEIIGILGCSNNKMRAININKNEFKLHLGYFTGELAIGALES